MKSHIKSAAELQTLVTEKDAIIAAQNSQIDTLKQQVDWLTAQFKLMQARQFGSSSEKTVTPIPDQLSMFDEPVFNEPEATADPTAPEPELEQITYRRRKQKGKREADFSGLPTEQIVHELPESERVCPDCGGAMHACGHDVLRRELTCVPAQYKVTEHVQTVYACRQCEQNSDHVPMKKSEVPAALIPNSGVASPSLLAQILNSKYALALPLYRQEQEFKRNGVSLSRQTMSNWIITAHQRWFAGLFDLLHAELLKNEILHADETTLQVLREDGRKASQKSYVWVYNTSGDAKRSVALYDYRSSRAGECASDFLDGFAGKLHTDGYDAYHCKLPPEITVVGCWAHMRRKFMDTLKSIPEDIRAKNPAQIGLNYCNKLFGLEAKFAEQKLNFEERYRTRAERSKPAAEAFFAWAKAEDAKNPIPKSLLGMALTYAVNQESWLMNVFLDGRLELSNNRAERSVRPFAVGRKNWLFCNTPNGADASAAVYSIVETAKANGLKPFAYLQFLLERLPYGVPPEDCLPWGDAAQSLCR
jgi:transposase